MKREAVIVVISVGATLAIQNWRASRRHAVPALSVAGEETPGGPEKPYQRLSVSDAVLEKMRDQAASELAAREAARAPGPGGSFGPTDPLDPKAIAETIKARFAPGEKPTAEKVRTAVADITADSERRWASSALARIVADCQAGKLDEFLALAAPGVPPAKARAEKCRTEAPRWRVDILKAYKEEEGAARAALEALKNEVRAATPGEGEAAAEKLNGLLRPIEAAVERFDGRPD
ncbi:hypothetical protein EPO15_05650 [bacterium]|nr:MAG: hypothetical protein EPO15_05650 [bacterium]